MAKSPRDIRKLQAEIQKSFDATEKMTEAQFKLFSTTQDITDELEKQVKIKGSMNQSDKDLVKTLNKVVSGSKSGLKIWKIWLGIKEKMGKTVKAESKVIIDIALNTKKGLDLNKKLLKTKQKILDVTSKLSKLGEKMNLGESLSTLDDELAGGMGKKIKDFLLNPLTLVGASVVAIGAAFKRDQEVIDQIGDSFGYMARSNTEIKDRLTQINKEGVRLDINSNNIMESASTIAETMGLSAIASLDLAESSAYIAKSMGISNETAVSMADNMMNIAGLSQDQYETMTKQVASMAEMNDLVPAAIMEDVAQSSEFIADYTKDGMKNIAQAAINAKKFGLNLSTVSKVADSLLDFETSITAEFEASAMIGRQLNFNAARRLALEGKTDQAIQSIVSQLGGASEFAEMDVLQRRSLAGAIGITTVELSKFMNKQDQVNNMAEVTAATLGKQEIGDIGAKQSISEFQEMQNLMKNVADELIPSMTSQMEVFTSGIRKSTNAMQATLDKMNEIGGTGMTNIIGKVSQLGVKFMGLGTSMLLGLKTGATKAMKYTSHMLSKSDKSKTFIGGKAAQIAGKYGLKGAAQFAKKIPLLGSLAAFGLAAYRGFGQGDWTGAGMEAASGLLNLGNLVAPGWGTGASLAMDAAILTRDVYGGGQKKGGIQGQSLNDGYITKGGQVHKFSSYDDVMTFKNNRTGGGLGTSLSDDTINKLASAIGANSMNNSGQKVVITRDEIQYLLQSRGY